MRAPPGTSGSPVFNRKGQLIGVEAAHFAKAEVQISVNAEVLLRFMRARGVARASP